MSMDWDGLGQSPMLYSKTATGATNFWQCWAQDGEVHVRWGQMDGAIQTASFKCKPKNEGKKNATTAAQQAIKEAKAKWVRQIRLKYSTDLETAGKTERIKPMLALDHKKRTKPLEYPVYIQPKLNGVRCLAYRQDGRVVLQSRGGKYYDVEHIRSALEPALDNQTVLDGELYLHWMSLQRISSLVKKPQPGSENLFYCLYDITTKDHKLGIFEYRSGALNHFIGSNSFAHVLKTDTFLADNADRVTLMTRYYEENGYEGGIVRPRTGLYDENKRSPDLLKIKTWEDDEFPITGWKAGKGKFENAVVFECKAKNGKVFDVTPTGTAEERFEMLQQAPSLIGKLLKVKYLGFTDDGAPVSARGIAIREEDDL